jgi:hypothetical protein
MNHLVAPWTTPIALWARHSQRRACHNAMAASTELSDARRERAEVEEYVVGTLAQRHPDAPGRPGARPMPAAASGG